jgi:hypothetical protein
LADPQSDYQTRCVERTVCYEVDCFYRKLMVEGSALLVTNSQGERGIVCDPWCRGPRGGVTAGRGAGGPPFSDGVVGGHCATFPSWAFMSRFEYCPN